MMRTPWLECDAFEIIGIDGEDLVWRGWLHQQSERTRLDVLGFGQAGLDNV